VVLFGFRTQDVHLWNQIIVIDSTGLYIVQATSNGITSVSSAQQVLVKTIPAPVITSDGIHFICSALARNQWHYYFSQSIDTSLI
jgi:hypothetical protein